MFTPEEFAAREAEAMRAETVDDSVRLSAELLVKCDEQLRQQLNAHEVTAGCIANFGRACTLQCDLLMSVQLYAETYATALTGLLVIDMSARQLAEGSDAPVTEAFALTALAVAAFSELTNQLPHDEFTQQHVPALYTLWASRLYILYQSVNKPAVMLRHLVQASHQMLEAMIEADIVKWPNVEINGRQVPALSSESLGDILSRSIALGLMADI